MKKGFTLIELLIVIAVLGILATVVMVAINPIEQLARGRDAGRKTTIGQLKNAIQAYYTSHDTAYPAGSDTWLTTLKNAGEIKTEPAAVTYAGAGPGATVCTGVGTPTGYKQNGWCYRPNATTPTEVIIYTRLESGSEDSKCASTERAFFLWSSTDAKAGVICILDAAIEPIEMTYSSYK